MTEPTADASLLAPEPREVRPLSRVEEPDWVHFVARPRHWEPSEPVAIILPGYRFRRTQGKGWSARPGRVDLTPEFWWDGSSGPAADTPDAWIASAAHDVACARVDGEAVLPGYLTRHTLYCRILWAQRPRPAPRPGCGRVLDWMRTGWSATRVGMDWAGLVLGNWTLTLGD